VCTNKPRLWLAEITTAMFAVNKSCLLTLCPEDCSCAPTELGYVRPHVLFTLNVMDCTEGTYLLLVYSFSVLFIGECLI
jgi:hypothetical protein